MQQESADLIAGARLKRAASELFEDVRARVAARQQGVPTFFDNFVLRTIGQLRQLDLVRPWEQSCASLAGPDGERLRSGLLRLRRYLTRRAAGRYVELAARRRTAVPRSEVDGATMAMSQGTDACLAWRGRPLFKTVFDLALYPMILWDVKPGTVIELGSGSGASAVWLADHLTGYGMEAGVLSLDLRAPALDHPGVSFISGDCERIAEALPASLLSGLPHPWVVIEDAHVNVLGVLSYLHDHLETGDYLIVEDSTIKTAALDSYIERFPDCYLVDTHYTDFFGRNATSCFDSIFRRG